MARQLLKNLIGDVNRLLTAGAASVHGHEKMRGYRSQIEALSARIPALAPLGGLIAEVVAADAPQAAISLLNLATRTRAIAAAICEAEPITGELTALPFATEFTSDTPVCEVVAQTQRFDNSRQYRQDVGRGHQPLPPMDLRFVGKLMGILKDRYYADTVVEEILPKVDRSFAAELLREAIDPTCPGDYRRLIGASRLDARAARKAVLDLDPELRKYFEVETAA